MTFTKSLMAAGLACFVFAAPQASAATITFTDFSSGFNTSTDTGSATQSGVTLNYSNDGNLDLIIANATELNINNGALGQFGTFTLGLSGMAIGSTVEIDLIGFFFPTPNGELLRNLTVAPSSVTTNGPSFVGGVLSTTNVMPGSATLIYSSLAAANFALTAEYGSTTNFVNFLIREVRVIEPMGPNPNPNPNPDAVPEPASLALIGLGLLGLGVAKRRKSV